MAGWIDFPASGTEYNGFLPEVERMKSCVIIAAGSYLLSEAVHHHVNALPCLAFVLLHVVSCDCVALKGLH